MRKFLFCALLLSTSLHSEMKANIIVEDPIEDKGDTTGKKPRNILPVVETSVQDDILNIGISYYLGNVQILVVSDDGTYSSNQSYYINGSTTVVKDFTTLDNGSYSITVVIESGEIYSGRIRKE